MSPLFRALFTAVLQCTVGVGDSSRLAGRRALATFRRAFPVGTIMYLTLAGLVGEARPALQTVALHLIKDLLGDMEGCEFYGKSEGRCGRLLGRMGSMLSAAMPSLAAPWSGGGGGGSILTVHRRRR